MFNYTFEEMVAVFEAGYYDVFWSIFMESKYYDKLLYTNLKDFLELQWKKEWLELPHFTYRGSYTEYHKDKNVFEVIIDGIREEEVHNSFPEWETFGSFKGTKSCRVNIPAKDMVLFDVGDISHYSVFWVRID